MFCGQCGKKVMDNMLFCPFCGAEIVIPDQDTEDAKPPVREQEPVREEEDGQCPKEEFVPLCFDTPEQPRPESETAPTEEASQEKSVEDVPRETETVPARRSPREVPRMGTQPRRDANTFIPPKDVDVDDLFMDAPDAYDDDYDEDDYDGEDEEDEGFGGSSYEYVDREEGSFFLRHVRGFVGLALFVVVALVLVCWSLSDSGQTTLARMNIAWKASTYAQLGDEAYTAGSKLEAAQYYRQAYTRSTDNYEYAHSSMVAYYEAGDIENAAAMLKKCIAMNADDPEPYQEMLVLYPDAATRPWEITQIVRDGYERTGNESLNIDQGS